MAGVNEVPIFVKNLPAVLRYYDHVRVFRSTTGRTGVFTEITTAADRPTLVADETYYEYADPVGTDDSWYYYTFGNTGTGAQSAPCAAFRVDLQGALQIISIDELKDEHLYGLLRDAAGREIVIPDHVYGKAIAAAVDYEEAVLDLAIRQRVYDDDAAVDGGVTTPGSERSDFAMQNYAKYVWLQLDHYPVISVEEVKLTLPSEVDVITFPSSWIQLDKTTGRVQVIPGAGESAIVALGSAASWFALFNNWASVIPDVFRIKYTAGFVDVPPALRYVIARRAAIPLLHLLGDLVLGPGIAAQAYGQDDQRQEIKSTASATNSGYGARIRNYREELKEEERKLRLAYKGIQMVAI